MIPVATANPGAAEVVFGATLRAIPLPVSAEEVGRLLSAYVAEVPVSAVRTMRARPELLDLSGPSELEPSGVLSGVVSAAIRRASSTARLNWFEPLD